MRSRLKRQYSALRFEPPRDNSRIVGKQEVIIGRAFAWRFCARCVSAKLRRDESTTELMPSRPETSGRAYLLLALSGGSLYCLSYTAVLVYFLPFESVPVMVTVRVLPSADTTPRPLIVILSPFLLVNASVWSLTVL